MTEQEWLACADPAEMLRFMRGRKLTDRKLLLFAVACCRRVPSLRRAKWSQLALEATDAFADGVVHPHLRETYRRMGQFAYAVMAPAKRAMMIAANLEWDCGRGRYVDAPI